MDYTEISNSIRMMIKAQGVDEKYIDKEETLYYDESGNVKHLIVKEGKLNADSDTVFVLGGVQADNTISLEELKTALGKSLEKEMKSTKDLKGSFIEILRKDNFRKILQVLSAFSRKFQTTLLPGNLTPRIMPNVTTNSLEVYAPEALAKEIEEYVREVDAEILEESVRKVRVVELKSINSKVLAQYMTNLRAQQAVQQQMLTTPYIGGASPMMNPRMMGMGMGYNMMNPMYNAAARQRNAMQQGVYGAGGRMGQGMGPMGPGVAPGGFAPGVAPAGVPRGF